MQCNESQSLAGRAPQHGLPQQPQTGQNHYSLNVHYAACICVHLLVTFISFMCGNKVGCYFRTKLLMRKLTAEQTEH